MSLALLAVLLPTLFWDRPVDTADTLRKAGIERLYVPAGREQAWRKQGFAASPFDRARPNGLPIKAEPVVGDADLHEGAGVRSG